MKTNVKVHSSDRNLFGVVVQQDSKTSFLSITDLMIVQKQLSLNVGFSEKRIGDLLSQKIMVERIYKLLRNDGVFDNQTIGVDSSILESTLEIVKPLNIKSLDDFNKYLEDTTLIKFLKKIKYYSESGPSTNRLIKANPYIWLSIAMELNSDIYALAIKWNVDGLIELRNTAGDLYNIMCKSVKTLNYNDDNIYKVLPKAINYIVFNKHYNGIRNDSSVEELKELIKVQQNITMAIDMGFVKTEEELMDMLRKMYKNKYK